MTYQIVRTSPIHCQVRDGIIGTSFTRLPNAYETLACAIAVAARLSQEEYDGCGDDGFRVVPWGGDVHKYLTFPRHREDDCIPF